MSNKIFCLVLLVTFCSLLIPIGAFGLDYPQREIEFIAAYGPGSNTDNFARLTAKFGEKYIGKPIVVVNKPGGGGVRGFTALAAAKPDGYTIGLISQGVVSLPYFVKGVTFNYKKSFRVIAQIDYAAIGFYTKKGGPFDIPLKELVKKAQEKPETITMGIGGAWSVEDFVRIIFEDEARAQFRMVMFVGGGADTMMTVLGGQVNTAIAAASQWSPLYKAGEVNVFAVSQEQRDPRFPNIPTFKELGYNVVLSSTHWVAAPAGTPDAIINFLAEAFKKAFSEQAFKETADNLGNTAAWEGPEGSLKSLERIDQLYQKVIKKYDLKPQ